MDYQNPMRCESYTVSQKIRRIKLEEGLYQNKNKKEFKCGNFY